MKRLLYIFLVTSAMSQEVTTPASLLGPKHFNHHAFDAEQYLKSLNLPVPTPKGPVTFPNDAPPPPRPPLVVISRPLIESIARSNLNPENNSIAESSSNGVSFVPYLGRVKDYKPYFSVGAGPVVTERYYQAQTSLPSLYKTIEDAKTIGDPEQRVINYYQIKEPEYTHQQSNEVHDGNSADYGNYAFSYAVKDKNTGDDFSHSQQSKGSATNGEYRVRLPDGRTQIVSYTADENGYKADVRYDEASGNGDVNAYNTVYDTHVDDKINNHVTEKIDYQSYDAQPRDYKKDYNNYEAKEYYNDYSSEYNENYLPHNNKFTNLVSSNIVSTVRPAYDEIKNLFTTNKFYNKIDSTTNYPLVTTDRLLFGAKPNLYTNILHSTPSPIVATTPRSYLVSTIASLTRKLNLNQPVLSERFIDKINKYLKYN